MQDAAIRTVALTLLHFLWQGTLIGVLAAGALRSAAGRTAQRRYLICLTALLACLVVPVVTAALVSERAQAAASETSTPTRAGTAALGDPSTRADSATLGDTAKLTGRATPGGTATATPVGTVTTPLRLHQLERAISALRGHAIAPHSHLHSIDLMSAGVVLWLLGALSVAAYYAVQWLGVDSIRRSALPLRTPERLLSAAAELLQRWKATANVSVMLSNAITTPIVIGLWRPLIIFPAATLARMSASDFELILLHEMAHIIRRDTWANALQVVIEILLFYHPVVHWLSRRARIERECACDDFVVAASGSAYEYAQALTTLALTSERGGLASMRNTSLQLGAAGGDLLLRLKNLAGEESVKTTLPRTPAQLLALTLLLLLSFWAYAPGGAWWRPGSTRVVASHPSAAAASRRQTTAFGSNEPVTPSSGQSAPDVNPRSTEVATILDPARARRTRTSRPDRTIESAPESTPTGMTPVASVSQAAASGSAAATSLAAVAESGPAAVISLAAVAGSGPAAATSLAAAEALGPQSATSPAAAATPTSTSAPTSQHAQDQAPAPTSTPTLTPTFDPLPDYPVRARLDGVEGSVVATVRVDANGRPTGLRVVEANPVGVFEGAVRRSLMQWRYNVGSPVTAPKETTVSYRLNFSLAGVSSVATTVCATATASRTCEPQ